MLYVYLSRKLLNPYQENDTYIIRTLAKNNNQQ